MKKIAFVAVLVAAIAGIVYGGVALAIPTFAARPVPTATPNVIMQSFDGEDTNTLEFGQVPLNFTYPSVRHVSLTLAWTGMDVAPGGAPWDRIQVISSMGSWGFSALDVGFVEGGPTSGYQTVEFDTTTWILESFDLGGQPLWMCWKVTVTYPA